MTESKVSQSKPTTASEVRLVEVLDAYLAAAQEGQAPTRDELLVEHPELAEDLEACLASLEFIGKASLTAAPLIADSRSIEADEGEPGIGDLGDFRLVAEVGRGGMGVVYEAVQRSLNRRVALKVLPFAAAMDPTQLRRFHTEALAAAQLHHTNIVPVYSVGCERGVHYYAMQFIEGQTLAQAIAERRRLEEAPPSPFLGEGGPQGRMGGDPVRRGPPDPAETNDRRSPIALDSTTPHSATSSSPPTPSSRSKGFFRTAAALGIQAAEALDHAHKVGIVHRDVKPANLLLDIQGNLWITDFGLARLRDETGLTITGDLVGTLRYMSPEQALAKRMVIDHRTDIYSLGATLYELVTLRPAMDGHDRQEVLRRIAQEEPPPPRRVNPSIPRELETILLKAISKEPESRYATAQELADDLRRFLDDKPIRARRPNLVERTAKWSRRHRVAVATAFLFLLLAVVTLATSTVLITNEQKDAERQRDQARKAVDEMYTEVAEQWLAQQAALEPVQQRFLKMALDYYERFAGEESKDPSLRLKTAVASRRVGAIQQRLERFDEAVAAHLRALAILEKLVAGSPEVPVYLVETALTHRYLGVLFSDIGRIGEAEQAYRRAVALQEKLLADSPSVRRYQLDLATSHNKLGVLFSDTGRNDEAERAYRRAISLYEKPVGSSDPLSESENKLAGSLNNLGTLLKDTGRRVEAEQLYRRAMALHERRAADSPSVPEYRSDLARNGFILANFLLDSGRTSEAEPMYRRAIALLEKLAVESPTVAHYRKSLAKCYLSMGILLKQTSRPNEAETVYLRAIALFEKLSVDSPSVPEYRSDLALSQVSLGELWGTDRPAEAERAYCQAIKLLDKLVADSPSVPEYQSNLALSHINMSAVLDNFGRHTEAELSLRRAITLEEKLSVQSPFVYEYRTFLAFSHNRLGCLFTQQGRYTEAEPELNRAVALLERLAADSPSMPDCQRLLAVCSTNLAILLMVTGLEDDALKANRRAIALVEMRTDAESESTLAWILATGPEVRLRDPQLALRLAGKAFERRPESGAYQNVLGVAQFRNGDWTGAIETLEKSMRHGSRGDASSWFFLAMAYWRVGDKNEAKKWYTQAADWMKTHHSQAHELRRFRAESAALLGFSDRREPTANKKEEKSAQSPKP